MKPIFYKSEAVKKGWGREIIIDNCPDYCGKLLQFVKGSQFSSHFHLKKLESFYVARGKILFKYFDLNTAQELEREVKEKECIKIPRGCPHQIEALEDTLIIEVSTQHFDSDSYRVKPGDSQKSIKS